MKGWKKESIDLMYADTYVHTPQIYTKKSIEKINEGDILEVIFDNPSSGETIVQMCDQAGHEILEKKEEDGKQIFIIEKG